MTLPSAQTDLLSGISLASALVFQKNTGLDGGNGRHLKSLSLQFREEQWQNEGETSPVPLPFPGHPISGDEIVRRVEDKVETGE